MKKKYSTPDMKVIEFEINDVITTSDTSSDASINDQYGSDNGWWQQ